MSNLTLTDNEETKLMRLASIIIPGTAVMPAVAELADFADLLRRAVGACGYSELQIRAALQALAPEVDWAGARALAAAKPLEFQIASTLVSAAYYMDPVVLERLGYPIERQHPAGIEEFVEEYESGILDPVSARGRRYRDVDEVRPSEERND